MTTPTIRRDKRNQLAQVTLNNLYWIIEGNRVSEYEQNSDSLTMPTRRSYREYSDFATACNKTIELAFKLV